MVLNKLANLRKKSNKGFTLVELIVVIVVLAILIAVLTPAIMGVIRRANIAADDSDARQIMITIAASFDPAVARPTTAEAITMITGIGLRPGLNVTVHFDANDLATGAVIVGGGRHADSNGRSVGVIDVPNGSTVTGVIAPPAQ